MMDVLTARTPSGHLHAVTCDHPAGFGLGFERTMTRMGLTVQRRPLAEHLELANARRTEISPPENAVPEAVRQIEQSSLDKNPGNAATADCVPAQESGEGGLVLPNLDEQVRHPVIGYATITHFVTLEGQPVPVATGPRGQGLVKPGQWRPATAADVPAWMRQPAQALEEAAPAPTAELSTPVDTPKPSRMCSLFDMGASA